MTVYGRGGIIISGRPKLVGADTVPISPASNESRTEAHSIKPFTLVPIRSKAFA